MPRRAMRCRVDLKIRAVTAPGVWLCSREDVYLSICMFGEYRTTNLVPSIFPLFIKEELVFDKTYYTALDPSEVADYLEDELVIIELLQLREDCDGATRLASYSSNARDFLFPYPTLAPAYASNTRELLLARTLDFPGIAPKLEFVTVTNISESLSPELDALEDALMDERKSRRRSRSRPSSRNSMRTFVDVDPEEDLRNYHKPTVASVFRSRSPSPVYRKKLEQVGTSKRPSSSSCVGRPPFVVRHLEKSLIGRVPGSGGPKTKKSKKKAKRSSSRPRSALSDTEYYSDYASYPTLSKYRSNKSLRDAGDDPIPVYQSRYVPSDDEDAEVAALTRSVDDLYIPPRSRSPSPLLYRSSMRQRYGGLSPAERIELRVQESLRRSREILRSVSPAPRRYSPYSSLSRNSLDDLAINTSIVRSRSPQAYVHLDNGKYWTEKAAQFTAKSHRQVFNDTLSSSYQKMYKNAY
ncbi:spermatogenesis-associated protein 6-like isoform X1 [Pecten maximus]|uniref:spermatogenesis-associated protein 6-like isoform X1 n=1 Tax=Pecten maximus TaxID=6579 RepID=UPI001458C539|nr:spermatogenesis-associated protein 6-like isoform X1 [Pecten maximus]